MTTREALPALESFPLHSVQTVRYSDTDRIGHVNNVVFAIFFEAGRVDLLFGDPPLAPPGAHHVLAHASIDFLRELRWPGEVTIGTAVERIGSSSFGVFQALYQNGACAAVSHSVMVQVADSGGGTAPLGEHERSILKRATLQG